MGKKREGGRDATRQNRTETETRPPQRGRTPLNGTDRAREKGRKGEREKGAMQGPPLTENACHAAFGGNTDFEPILQCQEIRLITPQTREAQAGGQHQRYRMSLSDGKFFIHAMLATQKIELARNGSIQVGSVLKLTEFIMSKIRGKTILIALEFDLLGTRALEGSPQHLKEDVPSAGPPSHPPAGQPQQQQQPQPQLGGYGNRGSFEKENLHQANTNFSSKPYAPQVSGQGQHNNSSSYSGQAALRGGPPSSYGNQQQQGGYGQGYGMNQNYQQRGGPPSSYGNQQQQQGGYGQGYGMNQNYVPKGAISRNEAPVRIVPIKSLNPYLNRWTIQARVTSKSEVRRWQNAKGEGTVFNFDVVDVDGGEIRICCFKEVCEKFNPVIEVGKVYMISKGSLRPARKQYNHLNNDFEIYLETTSTVEPCVEDERTSGIPSINFNFKHIMSIEQMSPGSLVDVIGVVLTVDSPVTIQRRDGTETQKRSLTVKDDSNASIELCMWGNFAMDPGQQLEADTQQGGNPVVAIKAARVGEFNGKTLGTISSTQLLINPDIPEAGRLRHWYDQAGGSQMQAVQLNTGGGGRDRRVVLSDIRDENLGCSGKPDYVECLVNIKFIRGENTSYPACSLQRNGRLCNKKVTLTDDNLGWCETCQAKCKPEYRWILQITACDHTGERWITCFGDIGDSIMGMTANELKGYEGTPQFDHALQSALFKMHLLKLKIAEDNYNDEKRIKCSILKCSSPNLQGEATKLLSSIEEVQKCEQPATISNNNYNAAYQQPYQQQQDYYKKPRTDPWNVY